MYAIHGPEDNRKMMTSDSVCASSCYLPHAHQTFASCLQYRMRDKPSRQMKLKPHINFMLIIIQFGSPDSCLHEECPLGKLLKPSIIMWVSMGVVHMV